jgi:acyl-[acyl carrier protein]--UDP-N-acetylglucosamine O-acyltransferase
LRYGGLKGYNAIGCRRAGMSRQSIHAIRAAFGILHARRVVSAAVEEMSPLADMPEVAELIAFIRSSKRGIVPSVPPRARPSAEAGAEGDED